MAKNRCTKNDINKCPICGKEFYIRHGKKNWLNQIYSNYKTYYFCSSKCKEQFMKEKDLKNRKYSRFNQ